MHAFVNVDVLLTVLKKGVGADKETMVMSKYISVAIQSIYFDWEEGKNLKWCLNWNSFGPNWALAIYNNVVKS